MPELDLRGLSEPNRHAQTAFREILGAWGRYAGRPDAPGWVQALRGADAVERRPPPGTIMGIPGSFLGRGDEREIARALTETLDGFSVRGTPRTSPRDTGGVATAAPTSLRQRQMQGIDPSRAREFARTNEWMRSAVNKLKGRVSKAERAIVPLNPEAPFDEEMRWRIAFLLENPNPRMDSWRSFIEPAVEDVITLGKGGWEYVPNFRGWPVAMVTWDAAYLRVVPGWDGSAPKAPRYAFGRTAQEIIGLRNDEATVILMNPTTYRVEGLGHVETLKLAIESDAAGNAFVRDMLKKYPPPGWLDLGEQATSKQVRSVAERLVADILGTGGILVTGGHKSPKFQSLWNGTAKDNELMAWSIYFARKISAVCGISPQDFGITLDINKASSETQESMSMEDGYKAILLLVEEYVNREIVSRFGYPEDINLAFRFKELTLKDRAKQARIVKDLMGDVPAVMLNESRRELDLPPLAGGNAVFMNTSTGLVAIIGEDAAEHQAAAAQAQATVDEEAAADEGAGRATAAAYLPHDPEGWRDAVEEDAVLSFHTVAEDFRAECAQLVRDYLVLSAHARQGGDPDALAPSVDVARAFTLCWTLTRTHGAGLAVWVTDVRTQAAACAETYQRQTAGLPLAGTLGRRVTAAHNARDRAVGRALAEQAVRALILAVPAHRVTPSGAQEAVLAAFDAWMAQAAWRVARRQIAGEAAEVLRRFLTQHPTMRGTFRIQTQGCDCQMASGQPLHGASVGRGAALALLLARPPCGGTHEVVPTAYVQGELPHDDPAHAARLSPTLR